MADFQTQCRLHGYKYSAPQVTKPSPSYRDTYHEVAPALFKTPRVQVHDCRPEFIQDFRDQRQWEAYLLKHGLNKTYEDVKSLHYKPKQDPAFRKPDKLLYNVGRRGSAGGDFNYPRGLATDVCDNVIVADTNNHRLQFFNQCGVYIEQLGSKGKGQGQFNEPSDVSVMPNGDFAVADKQNKRVQVFDSNRSFKFSFPTINCPVYVASDEGRALIVSTSIGTVEIYRRQAKLWQRFTVGSTGACPIAVNSKDEILVCDVQNNVIKYYNYKGKLLYQFQPSASGEGLACQPTALCLTSKGQILIADSLNHTVNLYTERGALVEQVIGPTDDAGAAQACALGTEGHLVTTEFTTNGEHCLKIFRYGVSDGHR